MTVNDGGYKLLPMVAPSGATSCSGFMGWPNNMLFHTATEIENKAKSM